MLHIFANNLSYDPTELFKLWPQGYKTFHMLNSTEHEISNAHKKLKSDVVFIQLINAKMPTIVGILTFLSRVIFTLR